MRAALLKLSLLGCVVFSASACSWSRFDDVTEDSPVVLLEKPKSMTLGFGESLAVATYEGQSQVLVGGEPNVSRAALFDIGNGESPGTTAVDTGYCSGASGDCFLSSLTAGFANASAPDQVRPLCFAVGSGTVIKQGLVVRCKDAHEYTLDMPPAAQNLLSENEAHDHPMTTDRTDDPVLLASLPEKQLAWFYPAKSMNFSQLLLPSAAQTDDPSFGRSLAVLAVDGGRVLALGVPGKSKVFLWKTDATWTPRYIGCLAENSGMGRALAAGRVNTDRNDDLVVSDDRNVHVIDGAALFELPETTSSECGFSSLPSGALINSFGCGSTSSLTGCATSEFGAALAVGDLDGDGDGEVIVGAPKMTVRGEQNAGALLVYDANEVNGAVFVDAKFMSSAESGDELGRSIVTPHIDKRDIIAAGAPGSGKAALFYCSALLAPGAAGARCP
jgi:FG-GAP repeat protein